MLSFHEFLRADAADDITADLLHVIIYLVCLLGMIKLTLLHQLVDKFGSLLDISLPFLLEQSKLVLEEHYIIACLL